MATVSIEAKMTLALDALEKDPKLSERAAAKLYGVKRATLQTRRNGVAPRRDTPPNSRKLTDLEEKAIIQYILELDSRSFPPRLAGVEDMANHLLDTRGAPRVGKNWAGNFVRRQPELSTRYSRRYDYQRAKNEDPVIIG